MILSPSGNSIETSEEQPINAQRPIACTEVGSLSEVNDRHARNEDSAMICSPSELPRSGGILMVLKELQSQNVPCSMYFSLDGNSTDTSERQPRKAKRPILCTVVGMASEVNDRQLRNDNSPISSSPSAKATDANEMQKLKA